MLLTSMKKQFSQNDHCDLSLWQLRHLSFDLPESHASPPNQLWQANEAVQRIDGCCLCFLNGGPVGRRKLLEKAVMSASGMQCTTSWWFDWRLLFSLMFGMADCLIFFKGAETTNQTITIVHMYGDNQNSGTYMASHGIYNWNAIHYIHMFNGYIICRWFCMQFVLNAACMHFC